MKEENSTRIYNKVLDKIRVEAYEIWQRGQELELWDIAHSGKLIVDKIESMSSYPEYFEDMEETNDE